MIKLLGDESVGADGKLILGGVGEKKNKRDLLQHLYYVFQLCQRGGANWLKYLLWEDKSALRLYEGCMKVSHEPEALLDPY